MRTLAEILLTLLIVATASCSGPGASGEGKKRARHVADTGYTGIENVYKDNIKVKEVEYKNGVRDGVTRIFYKGGVLEQEIFYSAGKKDGTAKWYYPDGKLFRTTPYVNDTINGSQIQYYKSGKIKARLDYVNGLRVPGLEENTINGIRITDYPGVTYRVSDEIASKGVFKIFVEMSDMSENVKFYRGDFTDGLMDLTKVTPLLQNATTGYLDLKRSAGQNADSVIIIASYLTNYGNRLYLRLAVPLPYKDLN